jgi:hypothetical protein
MAENGGAASADRPDAAEPEQPILNLVGERVALGPRRRELVPLFTRWADDLAVTRTRMRGWRAVTLEQEEAWYGRVSRDESLAPFLVYERASLRPIGIGLLRDLDHAHGTADPAITIGEHDCWDRGLASLSPCLPADFFRNFANSPLSSSLRET